MIDPGPTPSQSSQPHLEDGSTYRALRPNESFGIRCLSFTEINSPMLRFGKLFRLKRWD